MGVAITDSMRHYHTCYKQNCLLQSVRLDVHISTDELVKIPIEQFLWTLVTMIVDVLIIHFRLVFTLISLCWFVFSSSPLLSSITRSLFAPDLKWAPVVTGAQPTRLPSQTLDN